MKFNTKTIHAGQKPEETSGAVMPPIFQTSTYAQEAPNKHKGYDYARVGNPTRTALEQMIAGLEGADEAACFSSGVAAMDSLMKMLRPGDHVVTTNDLYGGSYRLFTKVFEPYGIDFTFVDMTDLEKVKDAITPQTKLMWIETPTNPLLRIVDIEALVGLAKPNNILTVVDNTFASPYLQRPLEFGADAVLHSATKYLAGHSDVIHGAVASSNQEIMENLRFQTKTSGAVPGPMDCYLTLRGIKTLSVRVQRSVDNAKQIASFLESHDKVESVLYPGLSSHPQHELAAKQMDDFGAMLSFTLKDDSIEAATKFMSNTSIFTLAESLGGVESLISHPASMTHGSIPKDAREKAGLKDSLIRISVGIEDADDLIDDLKQAF
ncbi:MAG: cystathionine gamma-synthase [Gracilimonas sp.]|uniref:cystathionine gamma-synthase n=1 Tax=Gracilimonas sp. TaxID=1974203 RepID=UPI001B0FCD7E|nr:cystathionine gamma-synthase [Gracilimonas sp.]MBO6585776.1 cystathionine gamma-synthase [Gracilimonas sp.]MBO6616773.1 cystathionine gamma-synthase [Gracilimonas sp.]